MDNLILENDKRMSSREIAEITGKQHAHVLEAIRKMEVAWLNVSQSSFRLAEYTDEQGKKRPEYQLNKTECLYIGTKFNDEARAKLVLRWEILEKEKQLQKSIMSEAQMILNTLMVVQNQSKAIEAVETRLKAIEQNQSIEIKQDYFSILAYCKRNHIQLSFSEAIQKGKIATKLSKEKGFDLRQIPDERYGYVNSYKDEILKETFQL